jgi:hypothetical protein
MYDYPLRLVEVYSSSSYQSFGLLEISYNGGNERHRPLRENRHELHRHVMSGLTYTGLGLGCCLTPVASQKNTFTCTCRYLRLSGLGNKYLVCSYNPLSWPISVCIDHVQKMLV